MLSHQRAAQIWPLLTWAATNRQVLSYDLVGTLIGVPRYALAQLLEPIQSHCILNKLPALTVLVVDKDGYPGTGFIAASDVPAEQQRVFRHEWLKDKVPTSEDLLDSVRQLPSCGIPEAAHGPA
jgi:hypothetical protein